MALGTLSAISKTLLHLLWPGTAEMTGDQAAKTSRLTPMKSAVLATVVSFLGNASWACLLCLVTLLSQLWLYNFNRLIDQSDDELKKNSALPAGSLKSKLTWLSTFGYFATSAFLFLATRNVRNHSWFQTIERGFQWVCFC